jgi:hypothetical protein
MPPADTITNWAAQLRTVSYVRRVDVVRTFCQLAGKACGLFYSNPWADGGPADHRPARARRQRDVGAVMMFFFDCPAGTNCAMDWANTHAWGMLARRCHLRLRHPNPTGFYTPEQRRLLASRAAWTPAMQGSSS